MTLWRPASTSCLAHCDQRKHRCAGFIQPMRNRHLNCSGDPKKHCAVSGVCHRTALPSPSGLPAEMQTSRRSMHVLVVMLLIAASVGAPPGWTEASGATRQTAQATRTWMTVFGGTIEVDIGAGDMVLSRTALLNWVRASANAVSSYFGRFPVKRALVKIVVRNGTGIGFATATYEGNTGVITVPVGRRTAPEDLAQDWVLTHEMVHLGFPLMGDRHRWLAEGMATYVEPLARLRTGLIPAQEVWGDLVRMLPHGLPAPGDRGLNHTPTWGRTYWGGALYFLVADLEIRKRTNNKKGLEDCLGAITAAGGDITSEWQPLSALAIGDTAVATTVLTDLYQQMKEQPLSVDLPRLWKLLGISSSAGRVVFDDRAPLAHVRQAINRGT